MMLMNQEPPIEQRPLENREVEEVEEIEEIEENEENSDGSVHENNNDFNAQDDNLDDHLELQENQYADEAL